jgi:hypothetical protein
VLYNIVDAVLFKLPERIGLRIGLKVYELANKAYGLEHVGVSIENRKETKHDKVDQASIPMSNRHRHIGLGMALIY